MVMKKRNPALEALERAEEVFPDSGFVISCRSFYQSKGFLTVKQIDALLQIEPEDCKFSDSFYEDDDFYWRHDQD